MIDGLELGIGWQRRQAMALRERAVEAAQGAAGDGVASAMLAASVAEQQWHENAAAALSRLAVS